ncbi:MAG: hypothetical protein DRR04_12080 [Gammaproteobacteria bacterium]|nr:MAG: hypothetical protein DRQ97_12970 [Gammaproteobacteria bacterium]RLA57888.1 MAG: hypothetical protein DRR04_12080 [Gammaproteobacteria bacterium]
MKSKYTIVCDTREQKPLWKTNVTRKKLDVGDYSIEGFEDKITFERKSLADLFGTLGKGHARFKKELERAITQDIKFFIVIEGSLDQCLDKDFPGSYNTKMKGHVIVSILHTIMLKYNIHVVFCTTRNEMKKYIRGVMTSYVNINVQKKIKKDS